MNGPALTATLTVHAGLWGLLNFLPQKTTPPARTLHPIAIMYRKPAPPEPPVALPAPPPPAPMPHAKKRRPRRAAPAPEKKAPPPPPPPILTTPSPAPTESAVTVPTPPAVPAAPALPKISEAALPEGYVEEAGFTFAPLYRVTQPPRLLQPLKPTYPSRAREFQKEGIVILEVDIDLQGRVISARIIEEPGWGFGEAALKAIQNAAFSPAKIDATAVPVRYRIPIRFQMDFS